MRKSSFVVSAAFVFVLFMHNDTVRAQANPARKPVMLVTWFGPGAIALPSGPSWKPESLTVYDQITRPVAQFTNTESKLAVSYILFENQSGNPTAQGCRDDAINPIVQNAGKFISKRTDGQASTTAGDTLATSAYVFDMSPQAPGVHQPNLFGFAGNAKTCAEIHISSVIETPAQQAAMNAVLLEFRPNLTYQPEARDYFILASALFKTSPGLAAPYDKSALDAIPAGAENLTFRRVTTDQLVMALGMSGDLKNSRAVAERAVASDPDYPLNYYNLACADAENGDAANARLHLQQAFDRRANVLKGESMPDPTSDDSILKLKKDKAFWAFVQSLPKS